MASSRTEQSGSVDFVDRFFGRWPQLFQRPLLIWPGLDGGWIDVDEYREDGALVVRAELPGIDPAHDVEVSVHDDALEIAAQRKEDQTKNDKQYMRRELRYGSLRRFLPLPAGTNAEMITATYKDGVLEVRVPIPKGGKEKSSVQKIAITAG